VTRAYVGSADPPDDRGVLLLFLYVQTQDVLLLVLAQADDVLDGLAVSAGGLYGQLYFADVEDQVCAHVARFLLDDRVAADHSHAHVVAHDVQRGGLDGEPHVEVVELVRQVFQREESQVLERQLFELVFVF
jgi:hypothetical protein